MKINGVIAIYNQLFFIKTPWGFSTPSKAKWRNDAISINRLSRLSSDEEFSASFSLFLPLKKALTEFFHTDSWRFSTPSKDKWRNDAISINQLYRLPSEKAFLARFSLYEKLLQEFFSTFFIHPL